MKTQSLLVKIISRIFREHRRTEQLANCRCRHQQIITIPKSNGMWFDNLSSFLQGQRQRLIEEFNHNRQEDIPIEPPTVSVGPTMSRRRGRNHCPANDDDDDNASTFEEEEESDNTENSDSSSNCSPSMATGAKSTSNIYETQLGPPLSMPTPEPLFPGDTSQAAVVGPAVNQHGDNVLHAKVSGCPPVEAVKALLEACGDDCVEPNHLAQQYNVDGLLPIHGTCFRLIGFAVAAWETYLLTFSSY